MLYYLGGKSCDAFVQPTFFLAGNRTRNGVATVVAFKNLFILGTCFQLQSTPDNSNLQGKSEKGSSYREFEENSGE